MGALLYAFCLYAHSYLPLPAQTYTADAAARPMPTQKISSDLLIDLNTATFEQLDSLPGVGEKTAQAILDLRAQLGIYRYREELLLIHGFGPGKLAAIYDLICVK